MLTNCRNYCPALIDQNYIYDEIKECLKQKEFKQYSVIVESVKIDDEESAERIVQFILRSTSNESNIFEEVLIFDEIDLVGSLGGSLGLFVGFSFFGYVTPILDAVFDKVATYFLRMNQPE